ncbi:PRA1 family protein F2-like [Salvia splendens]|uniref:PRA1 family protein F2-like n=1 Tax=Salvia splendens TaxID=180675 RepID=UPI001C27A201|nr:PRA1 family protein F2-like [Salvia splendens]
MTNYGTIPTSSTPQDTNVNREYISRVKTRFQEGLATRRPWREIADIHSFSLPRSFSEAVARVKTNLVYFSVNYAIVALAIVFLSLLWHPTSLIVFLAMLAVWLFLYFLRDEPLVIFGRLVSDIIVLIVLGVLTIFVLLFTDATTEILSSLLVAVVVVLVHAAVRRTDNLCPDEESAGLLRSASPSS